MKIFEAKVLDGQKYKLGESPFFTDGVFSFVDIMEGKLYYWKGLDINSKEVFCLGEQMGAAVPTSTGGFILAGTEGIYLYDKDKISKMFDLKGVIEHYRRCNDAKADPCGRLFVGTSNGKDGYEQGGNLYRLDNSDTLTIMEANTRISNGMAWNKAKDKFYFSDTLKHQLFVFDYDISTGNISNKKVLCDMENSMPDGLCIDDNDNLWVAIWGGKRVECRDGITGELLAKINVDSNNVTSCCFGGDDYDKLLITTSGNNQEGLNDGSIFIAEVGVTGPKPDKVILN